MKRQPWAPDPLPLTPAQVFALIAANPSLFFSRRVETRGRCVVLHLETDRGVGSADVGDMSDMEPDEAEQFIAAVIDGCPWATTSPARSPAGIFSREDADEAEGVEPFDAEDAR